MHIRQTSSGNDVVYQVTAFDQVEDGANLLQSAKKIFGDKFDAFQTINSDEQKREKLRSEVLASYVKKNGLSATFYQDYGWPAKKIGEWKDWENVSDSVEILSLLHLCHGPNFTGKSCNIEFDKISLRNSFQPDDGDDQSSDEEQSPECGWLVENKDANQYSANGTYPCPDWVSCAQWYCLGRFGQQRHTQNRESNKTSYPPTPFYPGNVFCTSETIGEAYFAKPCDN